MTTMQQQIRGRIERFIGELDALVREAAVASVMEAFGSFAPSPEMVRPPPHRVRASPSTGTARATSRNKKGRKRDARSIAELTEKLALYVAKTPGMRIEQIAKSLGTTTKELRLPMRRLVHAKRISPLGVKRATTYHPA